MIAASCCGELVKPDVVQLVVWAWAGRVCAGLLLAEAVAAVALVGRGSARRWQIWRQKMVVWLCALALAEAIFAQYAAAQYQQLVAMGATSHFGCPDWDCTQATLASLAGVPLVGILLLGVAAGTLLLGAVHLAAEA